MEEPVPGWTSPIRQALTAPQLLWGVPRLFGVLNFGGGMMIGLHFWPAIAGAVLLHLLVAWATTYHPHIVTILLRHLAYKAHYDP